MHEFGAYVWLCIKTALRGSLAITNNNCSNVIGGMVFILCAFIVLGEAPPMSQKWTWALYTLASFGGAWVFIFIFRLVFYVPYRTYIDIKDCNAHLMRRIKELTANHLEFVFEPNKKEYVCDDGDGESSQGDVIYRIGIRNISTKTVNNVKIFCEMSALLRHMADQEGVYCGNFASNYPLIGWINSLHPGQTEIIKLLILQYNTEDEEYISDTSQEHVIFLHATGTDVPKIAATLLYCPKVYPSIIWPPATVNPPA